MTRIAPSLSRTVLMCVAALGIALLASDDAHAVTYNVVTYSFNPANRTLTLNGDTGDNVLTASWRGDRIVLTSSGTTRVMLAGSGTLSTSATINSGTGNVNVTGDLGLGNDSVTLVSMPITTLSPRMNGGNDTLTLSYCIVTSASSADGQAGTDTFKRISTTVANNANFENNISQ